METLDSDCSIKIGAIHHLASLGTDNLGCVKKTCRVFSVFHQTHSPANKNGASVFEYRYALLKGISNLLITYIF